ncbi:MAG: hypothetical protein ACPHJD_07390 [Poseidonia sp.]
MGGTDDTASSPPRWYPHALVDQPCDPTTFADGLPSPWGRVHGWNHTVALDPAWWSSMPEGGWGAWPEAVTSVTVIEETRHGLVVQLDDAWTAHLYPFPTGKEVSTLALYSPWAEALASAPVLLPVAGLASERGDHLAVFPRHVCDSVEPHPSHTSGLAQAVGKVHASLVQHQTPNTERRWNERLKSMEDGLKSTTLWRAPHTKHVVGLPPLHLTLEGVVSSSDGLAFVPQPRALVDHLLAPSERLPGVATMARFEQRLSLADAFSSVEERQAFYAAWGAQLPAGWTSPASVSTVNGGVWIWRYEAILLMLAEARAFGLEEQTNRCDRWLLDVSRIQARLGELRTVHAVRKGGVYAAIAAALIGSGPAQVPVIAGAVACSLVAHAVHRRRVPPPF